MLPTRPKNLTPAQRDKLDELVTTCPAMTALQDLVGTFAALLRPDQDNTAGLDTWIEAAHTADLPHIQSFARGLLQDHVAETAAMTTPHHNGRTEDVNTRTQILKRQTYGRAGFTLLRHRILPG